MLTSSRSFAIIPPVAFAVMKLLSINAGTARSVDIGGRVRDTGIYKVPVASPVAITPLGVDGDAICDAAHHGGPDQAIYVYCEPDYAWWRDSIGRDLAPGAFGENLTLSGFASAEANIGDRFVIGDVIVEVTAPRLPCGTFAHKMGDPTFVKRFREAERPGLYCRVVTPGQVDVGASVEYVPFRGTTVSVLEMFRDHYAPVLEEATLRRYLNAPIASRTRRKKEEQLMSVIQ